jgi:hypothetical protein
MCLYLKISMLTFGTVCMAATNLSCEKCLGIRYGRALDMGVAVNNVRKGPDMLKLWGSSSFRTVVLSQGDDGLLSVDDMEVLSS